MDQVRNTKKKITKITFMCNKDVHSCKKKIRFHEVVIDVRVSV